MLEPGTEAFVIVNNVAGKKSQSGDRKTLQGAARVRIESCRDSVYTVVVVAGSGVAVGHLLQFKRDELYVTPDERSYFGDLVRWFWSGTLITRPRPKMEES